MKVNSISPQPNIYPSNNNKNPLHVKLIMPQNQDRITISDAGRQLSISKNTRPENIERMNRQLDNAKSDPVYAKELARGLTHSDFLMGIDVSTISDGGKISVTRYTNGDLVNNPTTIKNVQKWQSEAKQYKAENIEFYNLEKEKGTSDLNIIMMTMERNMNLPESFRKYQGNDYL